MSVLFYLVGDAVDTSHLWWKGMKWKDVICLVNWKSWLDWWVQTTSCWRPQVVIDILYTYAYHMHFSSPANLVPKLEMAWGANKWQDYCMYTNGFFARSMNLYIANVNCPSSNFEKKKQSHRATSCANMCHLFWLNQCWVQLAEVTRRFNVFASRHRAQWRLHGLHA